MFADPQSVTYNAVAKSLPAISRGDTSSEYKLFDTGGVVYDLLLSHQFKTRNRAIARLRRDSYVSDPLVPASNIAASMSATLTIDYPTFGLLSTDAQLLGKALVGWLTDANLLKLITGET